MKRPPAARRFDRDYFHRYYYSPATRVTHAGEMRARAEMIAAVLAYAELPVRSILDAGCGVGLMHRAFAKALPRARCTGLEVSDYLCGRYGWTQGSVADYRPAKPADLLVCYDVLQYLDDAEAARALDNFPRLTRCALYFSALTRTDWRRNCERSRTDSRDVRIRPGAWYLKKLRRHFEFLGYGIWVRRDVGVIRWELEDPRAVLAQSRRQR
ncbi:MAG: methyltransferase domain-containing protein [Proteobacteria bacterium]|nr:methyltransferase domain-containing protein [Pseudomonadota bacterium]